MNGLLAHLDRLIATSTVASTCSADLRAHYASLVDANARSHAMLAEANAERHSATWSGIHRAADIHLNERVRASLGSSRYWVGSLQDSLVRRYSYYGLDQLPCKRTIREALNDWTPPTGGDSSLR